MDNNLSQTKYGSTHLYQLVISRSRVIYDYWTLLSQGIAVILHQHNIELCISVTLL